jgi:hypothetical protein
MVGPEKVQFAQAYDASGNENFSVEKESSSGVVSVDANRHHVKAFELEHSATILGIAKQRMEVKYAATRTVGADDAN